MECLLRNICQRDDPQGIRTFKVNAIARSLNRTTRKTMQYEIREAIHTC